MHIVLLKFGSTFFALGSLVVGIKHVFSSKHSA